MQNKKTYRNNFCKVLKISLQAGEKHRYTKLLLEHLSLTWKEWER